MEEGADHRLQVRLLLRQQLTDFLLLPINLLKPLLVFSKTTRFNVEFLLSIVQLIPKDILFNHVGYDGSLIFYDVYQPLFRLNLA